MPSLARVVRDFEPGTERAYSNDAGLDVPARVVAVASGLAFDDLLRTRVFAPLGIRDTGLGLGRAAPVDLRFARDPVVSGAGLFLRCPGLWGALTDYLTFVEFLRDGHSAADEQLLSPWAVSQLAANQVRDLCPGLNGRAQAKGVGFGFSIAVVTDAAAAGLPFTKISFG